MQLWLECSVQALSAFRVQVRPVVLLVVSHAHQILPREARHERDGVVAVTVVDHVRHDRLNAAHHHDELITALVARVTEIVPRLNHEGVHQSRHTRRQLSLAGLEADDDARGGVRPLPRNDEFGRGAFHVTVVERYLEDVTADLMDHVAHLVTWQGR